jgi:anti-sigma B factor antagonist
LRGEIDLSNAAELRERISTCLTDGATHLTVDMTALDFIDCAGISALAMAIHQLDGRDRLVVRNPPRSASMIIELTGLVAGVTVEKGPFVERAKDNGS